MARSLFGTVRRTAFGEQPRPGQRLLRPVERGLDGLPVRVLFTMVTPTVRAHLHLLSRLAYLLRQPRFLAAVQGEEWRETLQGLAREIEFSIPGTR